MLLYRRTELKAFLKGLDRGAKRTLSQNFLVDGNIVRNMVDSIARKNPSTVIEIGPGPGVMTQALLDKGYDVIAIEIDTDFAKTLPRLSSDPSRLHVIESDALLVSLLDLKKDPASTAILSNLPYHLTTPFLTYLCEQKEAFSEAVLMMQHEVAKKICRQNSVTSLMVHLFFQVEFLQKVSRNCFDPAPKVDSAIVRLTKKDPFLQNEEEIAQMLFFAKSAFQSKRKCLISTLRRYVNEEKIRKALRAAKIEETARPEELDVKMWENFFLCIKDL